MPVLLLAAPQLHAQLSLDAASGQALFERNWVTAPASTRASDGLGPFYNARSCSACHPGGGRGTGWQALTLAIDDPVYGRQLQPLAIAGLRPEATLAFAYEPATLQFDAGSSYTGQALQVTIKELRYGALHSGYSARLAPSLYGVARLARVSETTLEALADPDDLDGDGISGRLAHSEGQAIGRLGWKAQSADLPSQIAKAFSLDIGMSSAGLPSAYGDCTPAQTDCLQQSAGSTPGLEPTEVSPLVEKLVLAYIESLAIKENAPLSREGLALFKAMGCQGCHIPEPEPGLPAFTDLLLHDMGQGLSDSLASHYAASSEWRTAPLWRLSATSRFLHDGRAASVDAAILWHGGEAEASRDAYRSLNPEQKQHLIEFLFAL